MSLSDDEREETIRVNHNSGSEHCDTCFVLGRLAEVREEVEDITAGFEAVERQSQENAARLKAAQAENAELLATNEVLRAEIARLRAPPSADAMQAANHCLETGPFRHNSPGRREAIARAIEQARTAERAKVAEAVALGLEAARFAHGWIGGLPVTPSFEDKRAAQAALELAETKLRALTPEDPGGS